MKHPAAGQLSEYKKAACEPENYTHTWADKALGIIVGIIAAFGFN